MTWYSLEKRKAYLEDETAEHQPLPPFLANPKLHAPSLYLPSAELADAVNVALKLGLPLLLTGDPGCGKTELAHHIAWFFSLGEPILFNAQTSSSATDLFYHYDALGHFQYSQNSKDQEALRPEEVERRFVRARGLGEAIKSQKRRVVLIDEIDKAPRDLPNDVLDAMDKLRFYIPEVDKWYETGPENRPVILLTSNSEKNLPDAFLRRVVYFHIDFPAPSTMLEIVASKVGDNLPPARLQAIVGHFYALRESRELKLKKAPATAELIQWAYWLEETGFPVEKLKHTDRMSREEVKLLRTSYAILAKTREDLNALTNYLDR